MDPEPQQGITVPPYTQEYVVAKPRLEDPGATNSPSITQEERGGGEYGPFKGMESCLWPLKGGKR